MSDTASARRPKAKKTKPRPRETALATIHSSSRYETTRKPRPRSCGRRPGLTPRAGPSPPELRTLDEPPAVQQEAQSRPERAQAVDDAGAEAHGRGILEVAGRH